MFETEYPGIELIFLKVQSANQMMSFADLGGSQNNRDGEFIFVFQGVRGGFCMISSV